MKQKKIKNTTKKQVTLEGMMTFGLLETGLHTADFMCSEDVEMEAFIAKCKVQGMRDGNVYVTELPKRVRNKPMFREDNMSLSVGRDGIVYVTFRLPVEEMAKLPEKLTHQASLIAQKVLRSLTTREGRIIIRKNRKSLNCK